MHRKTYVALLRKSGVADTRNPQDTIFTVPPKDVISNDFASDLVLIHFCNKNNTYTEAQKRNTYCERMRFFIKNIQ